MAYILYINGHEMELGTAVPISQTRQVNDLAKLDNRQSSVTNKFTLPFTPKNVKAMEHVYLAGNQSNIPYQKNVASLYDADSGVCLIYKGWAIISQTTKKGYEIYVYDGIIDLYRKIENKTLTDINISGLDHAKSITNIIASWGNTLPYMYAIADYNGNNLFTTPGGTNIEINTDYQVPSARVSYIWNQIHLFAGFTFSGSYFQKQDFLNLFMSFPKPVPTLVPHRILLYSGSCFPRHSTYSYFSGSALFTAEAYLLTLPRENFTNAYTSVTNDLTQTALGQNGNGSMGFVYDHNPIHILQNGVYSIDAPANINFNWIHTKVGMPNDFGVVALDPTGSFKTYLFNCLAGDTIGFLIDEPEPTLSALTFEWQLNRIDGYDADFTQALVDFKATEFINEIVQRGGLTAFKDKYSNHIEYLTIDEILQSNKIEDWSSKFQYKDSEKYKIGNYAKINWFKYRHNDDNDTQNNGYITINDENLADENTILTSKIYSPDGDSTIAGVSAPIFKIWEKELQEDSTIKYKDLSGRFYFMRFSMVAVSTTISSKLLNTEQEVTQIGVANFNQLGFNEIINNNYRSIQIILDKAKIIDGYFYLKPIDIERFNFKSLIFVEQLGSYYLVNKIMNFVKGKITKCELIEVDYKNKVAIIGPPNNSATYITIDSFTVVGCVVTVVYSTDATIGTPINLICGLNNFGMPIFTPPDPIYGHTEIVRNTAVQNTVTFSLEAGAYYQISMNIQNISPANVYSNIVYFENIAGCVIVSPTNLTITAVTMLSQTALYSAFKIDFTTDAVLPRNIHIQNYKTPTSSVTIGLSWGWSGYSDGGTASTGSINHTVSRIFGDAIKLQIKIGTKESNEFTI
jgi:hypothetical protein